MNINSEQIRLAVFQELVRQRPDLPVDQLVDQVLRLSHVIEWGKDLERVSRNAGESTSSPTV